MHLLYTKHSVTMDPLQKSAESGCHPVFLVVPCHTYKHLAQHRRSDDKIAIFYYQQNYLRDVQVATTVCVPGIQLYHALTFPFTSWSIRVPLERLDAVEHKKNGMDS